MGGTEPAVLYHGSPVKLQRLEPRTPRGIGPMADSAADTKRYQQQAVYATHRRELALAFALPFVPDTAGRLSWSLDETVNPLRITLHAGSLDRGRIGYLYTVSSVTFTPVDEWPWVSFVPVELLWWEPADPRRYDEWVSFGEGARSA